MHIGANMHPPSGRYQHTHKHQSEDRLAELSCIASSTSTLSLGAGSMHSKVGQSPSPKSLALQHGANFLCPVSLGNKNQAKSRGTVSHVKMVWLAHMGVGGWGMVGGRGVGWGGESVLPILCRRTDRKSFQGRGRPHLKRLFLF